MFKPTVVIQSAFRYASDSLGSVLKLRDSGDFPGALRELEQIYPRVFGLSFDAVQKVAPSSVKIIFGEVLSTCLLTNILRHHGSLFQSLGRPDRAKLCLQKANDFDELEKQS